MEVPFYSQHWNLENWEQLGFVNQKEGHYWQNSCCGILCLKMATEALLGKEVLPIHELIRKGVANRAYSHRNGWSHAGLAKLANTLGVPAFKHKKLNVERLKKYIDSSGLVIVSIKWAFEVPKKTLRERIIFWRKTGGHLALLIGYDETSFKVHHTSTLKEYNWVNASIPFGALERAFTGRGVVLGVTTP